MILLLSFIAILIGALGFAPARHILFLLPIIFVILGFGLDKISCRINKKIINLILLMILLIIVQIGAFSLISNLKYTSEKVNIVPITGDVTEIIIQDSSYDLLYRNWSYNSAPIPALFANPALLRSGKTYL